MQKITFIKFEQENISHCETLLNMLSDYFDEICIDKPKDNIPKHILPKLVKIIGDETQKYLEWMFFCQKNSELIGFAIFQIDTRDNPSCKREGWGFIREFYIMPSCRRKGYAKQMCSFVEKKLLENGILNLYLTASAKNGIPFWEAMGYVFSGRVDDKNGNRIYEKNLHE